MPNDLASTLLMATDTPVLIAPAMNVRMWLHPANQRNLDLLEADGISQGLVPTKAIWPAANMAPDAWPNRTAILDAITARLGKGPLTGKHVLVTSGPTHEPIDPVRYIANRSSGCARHGDWCGVAKPWGPRSPLSLDQQALPLRMA